MANGSYEPIEKPAARVVDPGTVERCRRGWCEWCMAPDTNERFPHHQHHIKTRGARGGDVRVNLMTLCWVCHGRHHNGARAVSRALLVALRDAREALANFDAETGLVDCRACGRRVRPQFVEGVMCCFECGARLPASSDTEAT